MQAHPHPEIHQALLKARLHIRATLTPSTLASSGLVLLFTLAVASSTAAVAWVPGMAVLPLVALAGALLTLALTRLPWPAALAISVAFGLGVAGLADRGAYSFAHPDDPAGLAWLTTWGQRLLDGEALSDPAFGLYASCLLLWAAGSWLSWCVHHTRRALLGLFPGIAIFAANLLNAPSGQNGYVLSVVVLTLGILLWSNYTTSIANAVRAQVRLTGDARWDFWESGLVAMAALVVLAILLPPLSTVDRTPGLQHVGQGSLFGNGPGTGSGSIGFSTDVPLGGTLKRTQDIVFTYTITGDYSAPRYFRGVNVTGLSDGEWRYARPAPGRLPLAKEAVLPYSEDYRALALASFGVAMAAPPLGNADILFYPGQAYRTNRSTIATQTLLPLAPDGSLLTLDRLSSASPPTSVGSYTVVVEYSSATQVELKAAPTTYPAWVSSYIGLPQKGYRSPQVLSHIHALALQITGGATTPYDQASAIEAYLRSHYTYTLTPPPTPAGTDPLEYFLFTSKQGYCEFFATAMGDLLRSLNVPTRLVNGFGPGLFDAKTGRFVVRSLDAHTWVESYFSGYGWVTFEPTPDGTNFPSSRGATGLNLCLRDNNCDNPIGTSSTSTAPSHANPRPGGNQDPGGVGISVGGSTLHLRLPDSPTLLKLAGGLLGLLLLALALALRYLRPRTTMGIWRRTLLLAALAGAKHSMAQTPRETGRQLAHAFPEASAPLGQLADAFGHAAYAPPDLAASSRPTVQQAWQSLRPLLLRRILRRKGGRQPV